MDGVDCCGHRDRTPLVAIRNRAGSDTGCRCPPEAVDLLDYVVYESNRLLCFVGSVTASHGR
ncbi:hypothetical protein NSERUTF1_1863 [Nocardia seriolae]|nr:hypothetical protein NSERUTF1_1863 [Nocardia seriolae]